MEARIYRLQRQWAAAAAAAAVAAAAAAGAAGGGAPRHCPPLSKKAQ